MALARRAASTMKHLMMIKMVMFASVLICLNLGVLVKGVTNNWTGCRSKKEYISVIGNIQTNIMEDGKEVVMVSSGNGDVDLSCVRQQEGVLKLTRGKEPQKEPKNLTEYLAGLYSANITLWKAKENGFWDTEYEVECGRNEDDSLCRLKVVEIQDEDDLDNKCRKYEKHEKIRCDISAWTDKASQKREGKCQDENISASYNYFSYIYGNKTSTGSWVDCPIYAVDGILLDHNTRNHKVNNVKHISCNISMDDVKKGQPVLIKMEKSIPSYDPFKIKQIGFKCKESSIFSIKFDIPEDTIMSDKSSNDVMAKTTYLIIGLVGTVFILVLGICCWKQRQNYHQKKECINMSSR